MKLPFLLRLLWDPVQALDLLDATGKPDYAKIIPVTVIYALLTLIAFNKTPSLGVVLALLSASFGQSMFRSFLKAKVVSEQATASFSYAKKEEILEKRDVTIQAEETP